MEAAEVLKLVLDGGATLLMAYILLKERERNMWLVDWVMGRYDKLLEHVLDKRIDYAMNYAPRPTRPLRQVSDVELEGL